MENWIEDMDLPAGSGYTVAMALFRQASCAAQTHRVAEFGEVSWLYFVLGGANVEWKIDDGAIVAHEWAFPRSALTFGAVATFGVIRFSWGGSACVAAIVPGGWCFVSSTDDSALSSLARARQEAVREAAWASRVTCIFKDGIVAGDDALVLNVGFDDVFLEPDTKDELRNLCEVVFDPEALKWSSILKTPMKRGVILNGPPGNGKTVTARAIAAEYGANLVVVNGVSKPNDYSHSKVLFKDVFAHAAARAPCVVLLEEIDELIGKERVVSGIGTTLSKESLGDFLTAIDGALPLKAVLTIATTNDLDCLPENVKRRPARFDRVLHYDNPSWALKRRYMDAKIDALLTAVERLPHLDEGFLSESALVSEAVDRAISKDGQSFAMLQETLATAVFLWKSKKASGLADAIDAASATVSQTFAL